jgi:cation:H+ antiporter
VPELAVSGLAAIHGKVDIAVANVVGSNIFNIALILGICALIRPLLITGNTIRLEYPVLALVTLLCLVVAQDGAINRLDAILLIAVYFGFTAYMIGLVRQQVNVDEAKELQDEVDELSLSTTRPKSWLCWTLIVGGIVLLSSGAQATVTGAVELARLWGWSERVIGLTIVSAGTGLPEVVASLVSSIRGRNDVAIGNVIGSNLFNILIILGLSGTFSPLAVSAELMANDGWWMLAVTLVLFPIMYTGSRINRLEGGFLLGVYAVYVGLLLRQ